MSRIADDHYIKAREREQALEFVEYIVACAANYFQRKHGPLTKKIDAVATPSRKRNSPRKWTDHPVHGETFKDLNRQMAVARFCIRNINPMFPHYPVSDQMKREAEWQAHKNLLSELHKEYDSLRKSIVASEGSN
tara:strand:- start:51 stop:455 length:405 start_codon:yes stop_codon:yes gene_type:complete